MYAVTVLFEIKPGQEAAFTDLILGNAADSLSGEPGCHRYDVCRDPANPGRIFLYEVYADREAHAVHKDMEHSRAFVAAAEPMLTGKDVRTYDIVPTGRAAGV